MRIILKIISILMSVVLLYKWRYRFLDIAMRVPGIRKLFVKKTLDRYLSMPE